MAASLQQFSLTINIAAVCWVVIVVNLGANPTHSGEPAMKTFEPQTLCELSIYHNHPQTFPGTSKGDSYIKTFIRKISCKF